MLPAKPARFSIDCADDQPAQQGARASDHVRHGSSLTLGGTNFMDPLTIFDRAKKTLVEIPISEVLKERLALAVDQGATAEAKLGELREELSDVKAELKLAKRD